MAALPASIKGRVLIRIDGQEAVEAGRFEIPVQATFKPAIQITSSVDVDLHAEDLRRRVAAASSAFNRA